MSELRMAEGQAYMLLVSDVCRQCLIMPHNISCHCHYPHALCQMMLVLDAKPNQQHAFGFCRPKQQWVENVG